MEHFSSATNHEHECNAFRIMAQRMPMILVRCLDGLSLSLNKFLFCFLTILSRLCRPTHCHIILDAACCRQLLVAMRQISKMRSGAVLAQASVVSSDLSWQRQQQDSPCMKEFKAQNGAANFCWVVTVKTMLCC